MNETFGAPSIERLLLDGWETTNLGTASVRLSFLSGHDFSHAESGNKNDGALAPEGEQPDSSQQF
jgi:hypothetical protein